MIVMSSRVIDGESEETVKDAVRSPAPRAPHFRPVLLGSDLGTYSLARAFHETYGIKPLVVASSPRGPINGSSIIDVEYSDASRGHAGLVEVLLEIADRHGQTPLLLLACGEDHLDAIEEHFDTLNTRFLLPHPRPEITRLGRDKTALYRACAQLGIPCPALTEVALGDLARGADGQLEVSVPESLRFPLVVKPANSGAWSTLSFPGKKKAESVADLGELRATLTRARNAGYEDVMVVQELIPGDDTWGRTVTCYVASDGRMTMASSGVLLLGMHTPSMIGNSVAILTEPQPELVAEVERIAAHLGLWGFINVDLKVHPRDGVARVLDLNARIGRPNHYVTVSGLNPARAVTEDLVADGEAPVQEHSTAGVFSYVPKWLLLRYVLDPALKRRVRAAWRASNPDPLVYALDRNIRRELYRLAATANVVQRFLHRYPRPSMTGF